MTAKSGSRWFMESKYLIVALIFSDENAIAITCQRVHRKSFPRHGATGGHYKVKNCVKRHWPGLIDSNFFNEFLIEKAIERHRSCRHGRWAGSRFLLQYIRIHEGEDDRAED